jgi:hypothetical protein
VLIPEFKYSYLDRNGGARKADVYKGQLTYIYTNNRVVFIANGGIGKADYDETNPIYGKSQEDDRYNISAQIFYKRPFGWQPFGMNVNLFVTAAYFVSDSNINFYNETVGLLSGGVMFRF